MPSRTILFLQGPPWFFAADLAREVERRGARALRINLCIGDRIYWPRRGAVNFRGRLSGWEAFLRAFVEREGVTDIVYYADRLPYHVIAARVAKSLGINAIAYEFGYLRPDWVTLERDGLSAYSRFPEDPARIRAIAEGMPAPDMTARYPLPHALEATGEVIFNLANFFLRPLYPFYRPDRLYNPVLEYLRHIPRLLAGSGPSRRADRVLDELLAAKTTYFLMPLQLEADYQLRANSPFAGQVEAIEQVIASFAAQAPAGSVLLMKQHPLDAGIERWDREIARAAAAAGVAGRVRFINGGDLTRQLAAAAGVVLINSTVGVHAVIAGAPVKVLGVAVYDIEGLTFRGDLDAFWGAPTPPDPTLVDAFVRALAGTIQMKGNFYTKAGRTAAAAAMAERIVAGTVNEPGAWLPEAPRVARLRRLGIVPPDALGLQPKRRFKATPSGSHPPPAPPGEEAARKARSAGAGD